MERKLQLDRATLAVALADHVEKLLSEAIAERESASLVVSGGTTPKPFFEALRDRELDWSRVTIVLADERWVPQQFMRVRFAHKWIKDAHVVGFS